MRIGQSKVGFLAAVSVAALLGLSGCDEVSDDSAEEAAEAVEEAAGDAMDAVEEAADDMMEAAEEAAGEGEE